MLQGMHELDSDRPIANNKNMREDEEVKEKENVNNSKMIKGKALSSYSRGTKRS